MDIFREVERVFAAAAPRRSVCETCGEPECQCEVCDECSQFVAPDRCLTQPHTGEVICYDCLARYHRERED